MKKISVLIGLLALFFANLALAGSAVVTSVTGLAQVQTGPAAPRVLRQGDELSQGDTVSTGANSSVVLKFDDGEVAALTANSRMLVSNYNYNPGTGIGNVFLSLVSGGMRAVTGLIGRRTPSNVAYRAATATIGIRGTDATMVTNGTDVVVTVTEGSVIVKYQGAEFVVSAGNAIWLRPGANPVTGTIAAVTGQLPVGFQDTITQSTALTGAIVNANAGQGRQGGNENDNGQGQQGQNGGPQGGGGNSGGGGGGGNNNGNASGH